MQTTPSSSCVGSITNHTMLCVPNGCAKSTLPTNPVSFSSAEATFSRLPGTTSNYPLSNGQLKVSSSSSSSDHFSTFRPLVHPRAQHMVPHNSHIPENGCAHHSYSGLHPPFALPYSLEIVSGTASTNTGKCSHINNGGNIYPHNWMN